MPISAFKVMGSLGIDDSQFRQGMSNASRRLKETKRDLDQTERSAKSLKEGMGQSGRAAHTLASDLGLVSSKAGSASSSFSSFTRDLLSFGRSGSILPGLSNISNIIQALPVVGGAVHALINPLKNATEEGIKFNMMMESAAVGFEGVAGSTQNALRHISTLQAFAENRTPWEFSDMLNASRYMSVFNFSLDEQIPKLTVWGNAVAASGKISREALEGVVRAFGQMKAKGKASMEEMNQLAERGIPGVELLAKAIGKTTAQTIKLMETGKLKGKEAVEAITAMMAIDPRYMGQMERMMNTLEGRLSTLNDIQSRAQGKATEGLSNSLSQTIDAAIKRGDLATAMATGINSAITPVADLITKSVTVTLGGGITMGLTEAFKTAESILPGSVQRMFEKGVIAPSQEMLGIHSPSTVFIDMGLMCAQGFILGLSDGLDGSLQSTKPAIQRNLDRLGDEFKKRLIEMSKRLGTNSDFIANVMAIETAGTFSPKIQNPKSNATGLIQFMPSTARGLGTTVDELKQMSAIEQLKYVEKYFEAFRGMLHTQADVYNAVTGNFSQGGPDTSVYRKGSAAYRDNWRSWDLDVDGNITKDELGRAASRAGGFGSGGLLAVEIAKVAQGVLPALTPLPEPERHPVPSEFPAAWRVHPRPEIGIEGMPENFFDRFEGVQSSEIEKRTDHISKRLSTGDIGKLTSADVGLMLDFFNERVGFDKAHSLTQKETLSLEREYLGYLQEELSYRSEALRVSQENEKLRQGFNQRQAQGDSDARLKSAAESLRNAFSGANNEITDLSVSTNVLATNIIPHAIIATNDLGEAALKSLEAAHQQTLGIGQWYDTVVNKGEESAQLLKDQVTGLSSDLTGILQAGFKDGWAGVEESFVQLLERLTLELLQSELLKLLASVFNIELTDQEKSGGLFGRIIDKALHRGNKNGNQSGNGSNNQTVVDYGKAGSGLDLGKALGNANDSITKAIDDSRKETTKAIDKASADTQANLQSIRDAQYQTTEAIAGLYPTRPSFIQGLIAAGLQGLAAGLVNTASSHFFDGGSGGGGSYRPESRANNPIRTGDPHLIIRPGALDGTTRHAGGGFINGPGTGTSDSIHAFLSDGEFVMRASSVNRLGVGLLNFMNETGALPHFAGGFADGGMVMASPPPSTSFGDGGPSSLNAPEINVTFDVTINNPKDGNDVRRSMGQVAAEAGETISHYTQRYGR
jgi:tape measure domain-containing protein